MKPFIYQSLLKLGCLVGFLAMSVVGWNLAGGSAPSSADQHPSPVTRSARPRPSKPSGNRDAADAKLALIRNAATPAERMRATIELANSLSLTEFSAWLGGGWFTLRDGPELIVFTRLLRERWLREDPEGLVLWSRKNDSRNVESILAAWAENDPLAVIGFFKLHPDNTAELAALAGVARTNPDLAIRRLQELNSFGLSDSNVYYGDDLFEILAEKSPVAFESILDSLKEPVKSRAAKILLTRKFQSDYAGELRKLWNEPDGFKVFHDLSHKLEGGPGRIFDELANVPPDWRSSIASNARDFIDATSAEKWWSADLAGAGFSESQVNDLQTQALQKMAAANPELAIQRMAGLKIYQSEGDPSGNDHWLIIQNAIAANPEKTEELIALLSTKKDRDIAEKVMTRIALESDESAAEEIETPESWLEKVAVIDPMARYSYGSKLRAWDKAKLSALGERFHSLPEDQKLKVAPTLASGVSSSDYNPPLVGEAIRYLIENPPPKPVADPNVTEDKKEPWLYAASNYVGNLAIHDPETGSTWIRTLPDGEVKLWAQVNLHSIWMKYDPAAAGQWFKALPDKVQADVLKNTKKEK